MPLHSARVHNCAALRAIALRFLRHFYPQQQKEQQRIAAERERLQQQQRQCYLELLAHWEQIAIVLGRPGDYIEQIRDKTASYERGLRLSKKAIEACVQDTEDDHRQIQAQTQRRSRGLRL